MCTNNKLLLIQLLASLDGLWPEMVVFSGSHGLESDQYIVQQVLYYKQRKAGRGPSLIRTRAW